MNWAAHPILYQMRHPWHWLGYGQNTAILGLIGLFLYVHYTKRMMRAAEETRRLSLTPYLLIDVQHDIDPPLLLISNVGAPAVRCQLWTRPVTKAYRPMMRIALDSNYRPEKLPAILAGEEPIRIELKTSSEQGNRLYIVNCHDMSGGIYQLQVLHSTVLVDGLETTQIGELFVVPDTLFPFTKRLMNRLSQAFFLAGRSLRRRKT